MADNLMNATERQYFAEVSGPVSACVHIGVAELGRLAELLLAGSKHGIGYATIR